MESTSKIMDICNEQIEGDYWYADYLGTKIIVKKSNGYVNATKLCSDAGKRFGAWLADKHNKEVLKFYQDKITRGELDANGVTIPTFTMRKGTNKLIKGTYIHPRIIWWVGSWSSPTFALDANRIINDHIVSEAAKQREQQQPKM